MNEVLQNRANRFCEEITPQWTAVSINPDLVTFQRSDGATLEVGIDQDDIPDRLRDFNKRHPVYSPSRARELNEITVAWIRSKVDGWRRAFDAIESDPEIKGGTTAIALAYLDEDMPRLPGDISALAFMDHITMIADDLSGSDK